LENLAGNADFPGGLQIVLFIVERDRQKSKKKGREERTDSSAMGGRNEGVPPLPFHLGSSFQFLL
jgi:hypothetical protein